MGESALEFLLISYIDWDRQPVDIIVKEKQVCSVVIMQNKITLTRQVFMGSEFNTIFYQDKHGWMCNKVRYNEGIWGLYRNDPYLPFLWLLVYLLVLGYQTDTYLPLLLVSLYFICTVMLYYLWIYVFYSILFYRCRKIFTWEISFYLLTIYVGNLGIFWRNFLNPKKLTFHKYFK